VSKENLDEKIVKKKSIPAQIVFWILALVLLYAFYKPSPATPALSLSVQADGKHGSAHSGGPSATPHYRPASHLESMFDKSMPDKSMLDAFASPLPSRFLFAPSP